MSFTGQLVCTHELIERSLRNMFQDILQHIGVFRGDIISLSSTCWANLYIQIESVVEISTPEEMGEAQADVKGAVFVTQAEQSEDVHKALIPPKYHMSSKKNLKKHHRFGLYICILALIHNTPQNLLTSRGQVAVNKPKRCPIEEEGDADSSLVS